MLAKVPCGAELLTGEISDIFDATQGPQHFHLGEIPRRCSSWVLMEEQSACCSLLLVQLFGHVVKLTPLIFFDLLHFGVDLFFSLVQLLVLLLKDNEAASESVNTYAVAVVVICFFVCLNNLFEEDRVLFKLVKLSLSLVQLQPLSVD